MSTKKRILRNIGILILAVILGGVVGFIMAHFEHFSWPTVLNVELLKNIGRASLFILYPVTFFLLYQTHKVHGAYQREEDDDKSYELYRQTFKTLEYATILYNISSALTLFTLFVGVSYLGPLLRSETAIHIPFYDIALFLALILGQILVLKTTQKVRQYKLSAMPTIEEMKDYALSYDEGELQAHYEQSFFNPLQSQSATHSRSLCLTLYSWSWNTDAGRIWHDCINHYFCLYQCGVLSSS